MKTLVLDGNYQLHRALHIPELQALSVDGVSTGGVFGTLRIVKSVLDAFEPNRCIMVWDGGRSKRRMELYPEYKANRDPDPADVEAVQEKKKYYEDFNRQKNALSSILITAGLHVVCWPGAEADDVCALIARDVVSDQCIVASDDWDYLQLVDDRISLYRPMADVLIDHSNFQEQVGYPLGWSNFCKACNGDGSDNISGIPGVGGKSVKDLILGFCESRNSKDIPDISEIWDYASTHKSKRIRRIYENRDIVERNLSLVDFSSEIFHADGITALRSKIDTHSSFREQDLVSSLSSNKMYSIMKEFVYWSKPFRRLI